jgi:hypothetical protein
MGQTQFPASNYGGKKYFSFPPPLHSTQNSNQAILSPLSPKKISTT